VKEGREGREEKERGEEKKKKTYPALQRLLLLPHRHAPVVEHAPDAVVQRQQLLVEALGENVHLVLQQRALLAELLVGHAAVVVHLGAQLAACGAEEVGFVLDVGFGHEPGLGDVKVGGEEGADRFHGEDCLVQGVAARCELLDERVRVEVVDVGGRGEVWVFGGSG
jgi:hypothetical protein